uniref:Uncharacterized protein n=1 Tax=Arundo donax TaxID=35708 RepID=A0A0A8YEN6_ARUDO
MLVKGYLNYAYWKRTHAYFYSNKKDAMEIINNLMHYSRAKPKKYCRLFRISSQSKYSKR